MSPRPTGLLLLPLIALILALPAAAQTLTATLTGRIEKAPAQSCDPLATHRVACSDVLLKSKAVDLKTWEGRMVLLTGAVDPSASCLTVDVATIGAAPVSTSVLALFGYRPGRDLIVTTTAPAGSVVLLFFAFDPGFVPFFDYGCMLLNPLNAFFWSFNLSIGVAIESMRIPNDPSVIGLDILFQTAYVSYQTTLSGSFLNNTCFKIVK